jgi:hypothetical protein
VEETNNVVEFQPTEQVGLASPWVTFASEVEALFEGDDDVAVEVSDDAKAIDIYVDGDAKADALTKLLPSEKAFGNVTVKISVIPSNEQLTVGQLVKNAFFGNDIVSTIEIAGPVADAPFTFVVFEPGIIQFADDNLASPYGCKTILAEDVAREIFDVPGVFFSTDIAD